VQVELLRAASHARGPDRTLSLTLPSPLKHLDYGEQNDADELVGDMFRWGTGGRVGADSDSSFVLSHDNSRATSRNSATPREDVIGPRNLYGDREGGSAPASPVWHRSDTYSVVAHNRLNSSTHSRGSRSPSLQYRITETTTTTGAAAGAGAAAAGMMHIDTMLSPSLHASSSSASNFQHHGADGVGNISGSDVNMSNMFGLSVTPGTSAHAAAPSSMEHADVHLGARSSHAASSMHVQDMVYASQQGERGDHLLGLEGGMGDNIDNWVSSSEAPGSSNNSPSVQGSQAPSGGGVTVQHINLHSVVEGQAPPAPESARTENGDNLSPLYTTAGSDASHSGPGSAPLTARLSRRPSSASKEDAAAASTSGAGKSTDNPRGGGGGGTNFQEGNMSVAALARRINSQNLSQSDAAQQGVGQVAEKVHDTNKGMRGGIVSSTRAALAAKSTTTTASTTQSSTVITASSSASSAQNVASAIAMTTSTEPVASNGNNNTSANAAYSNSHNNNLSNTSSNNNSNSHGNNSNGSNSNSAANNYSTSHVSDEPIIAVAATASSPSTAHKTSKTAAVSGGVGRDGDMSAVGMLKEWTEKKGW
jgi:hypothetical protein